MAEGVDGPGVLDDAADVEQGGLRQARVRVAVEYVGVALGDALVHVHAVAVVANQRLGHEGGRFAVGVGDVVHTVLVDLHFVGFAHQRVEAAPISF